MFAPTPANDDPVFESFPEYNNFPAQWNLSELESGSQSVPNEQPVQPCAADGPTAETPIQVGEAYPVFSRDPFPKLRTFPVYWDLSR
jgi:hypothetical protein